MIFLFIKTKERDTEHVGALNEYATTLSLQGEFEKAKKYFRHALKIEPNNLIANLRLGKIYQTKLNDIPQALECYKRIIEVEPKYYKAHYQMGLAYLENKEFKRATECLKEALRVNPRYAPAWK